MAPSLRDRRIAIGVADDGFRDALRRTLERAGAVLSVHATAGSLLDTVGRFGAEICIIDVDLPDRGGVETAERIRDSLATPVVLVSAHLEISEIQSRTDFPKLPLPFGRKPLLDLILRLIQSPAR